jgi:hypothetical protein
VTLTFPSVGEVKEGKKKFTSKSLRPNSQTRSRRTNIAASGIHEYLAEVMRIHYVFNKVRYNLSASAKVLEKTLYS